VHFYRDIGGANWLILCSAVGFLFVAAPVARAADNDAGGTASPEALVLSGLNEEDAGDLSTTVENAPPCDTKTYPGGCINQAAKVLPNQQVVLSSNVETRGCSEVGPGEWFLVSKTSGPKHGVLETGTINRTLKGCGDTVFSFGAIFYTWTDKKAAAGTHDVFQTYWTTKDFPKICPPCKAELLDNLTLVKP
jgi:hypothetical protein